MVKDYDNILVPVDGSETAERAFDKAVKIALDRCITRYRYSSIYGGNAGYFDFRRYYLSNDPRF